MKNKKKVVFSSLLVVFLLFFLSACSTKKEENTQKHQVDIVTSTNIYANIAKNIVGSTVKSRQLSIMAIPIPMILSLLLAPLKK